MSGDENGGMPFLDDLLQGMMANSQPAEAKPQKIEPAMAYRCVLKTKLKPPKGMEEGTIFEPDPTPVNCKGCKEADMCIGKHQDCCILRNLVAGYIKKER